MDDNNSFLQPRELEAKHTWQIHTHRKNNTTNQIKKENAILAQIFWEINLLPQTPVINQLNNLQP